MIAAVTVSQGRIAPVFDVARHVRVAQVEDGIVAVERDEPLVQDAVAKLQQLAALGVTVIICGAISRPMEAIAVAYGIEVLSFLAGDAREVIEAWLGGTLDDGCYIMPGCQRMKRGRGARAGRRCRRGSSTGGR